MEGMVVDKGFWRGKKVLVTGHTGFKGGWLSLWLQSLGATVTGYSLPPPTNPSLFEVARVAEGMTSLMGDIRDFKSFQSALRAHEPEIVIHMAAQPLVRYSYDHPIETYETNVLGTVHVLEAVRTVGGVRVVIIVTSDKCYENREWFWGYRENEPMGGYDPYSSSKGCAELVTAAMRNSYFNAESFERHRVAVASVRAGNVIGGGDWAADRLIPDIMRAIMQKKSVVIRNPRAIRPWQHVLEPLCGYLVLAQRLWVDGPGHAEGWNFGPMIEDAKPVQWIVERLAALWDDGATWALDNKPQPHEAHYLKLDISKARTKLGWSPRWRLERALELIVEWHKGHREHADMRNLTLRQIEQYEIADHAGS